MQSELAQIISPTLGNPLVTPFPVPIVTPPASPSVPIFEPWEIALTDTGNADRFIARHGEEARYCNEMGSWLIWNGERWQIDDSEQIVQLGDRTARSIFTEVQGTDAWDKRSQLADWAKRSCSKSGISNMLKLAQSKLILRSAELDTDPWLLNCKNGVVDLRTGKLREHRKEDWITKQVPVSYDPGARCDRFLTFLDRVTDRDGMLLAYLQQALGYSLTGRTDEQCWFIAYGSGANGKSTLLNLFGKLLGGYSKNAPVQTFIQKRFEGGPREDLVRLRGARFVTIMEAEENQKLAASQLKQITGGDAIVARDLYKGSIQFAPQMKLWLATNHKPNLDSSDAAIWRRVRLIPFNAEIPKHEQDPELPAKLWDEAPGILAWTVKGSLDWQANGLEIPESVSRATNGYRQEMDYVRSFVDEHIEAEIGNWASKSEVFKAYQTWSRSNQANAISMRELAKRLKALGLKEGHTGNIRTWKDVCLTA